MLLQKTRGFSRLVGDQHGTSRLGAHSRGIGMHLRAGKPGQFPNGFGKGRDVGAEPHQRFEEPRGEVAGKQTEFLIEGGKARRCRPGNCRTAVLR
jgi:hypothetical protein